MPHLRADADRSAPDPSAMGSYYPDDYGPYHATDRDRDGWVRRAIRAIADPLDVTTPPLQPGRLLEIGTASGAYALAMRRRGWSVTGIELDPASARRAAARTGSRILCGDVLTMVLEEDRVEGVGLRPAVMLPPDLANASLS
jgi:2-polyprenyl-3-methyl-5-hydroxy-6-metoxy-1,4-benzoquinol methylase